MPKPGVIAISGIPGTGKSTVAKALGRLLPAPVWNLGDVAVEHELVGRDESGRDTQVVDTDALQDTLREEIPRVKADWLVVEGHYADVTPKEYIALAVVMRCKPDILWERLAVRGYSEPKVRENVQAEILGDCTSYMLDLELDSRLIEMDTSGTTPEAVASLLLGIVRTPAKAENYPPGNINWLQYLDERGELGKYMRGSDSKKG
ncbi:MAG: dephospho-CoA kinase [Promethearchaeota archaeon CR_4]|nr:MAG: dephospho-CoA kinase [Candidatus Lokiarchaeota archaeon CR_4]